MDIDFEGFSHSSRCRPSLSIPTEWMVVAMDKCTTRVRGRDACIDNTKVTTIKEKQKEKENICLLYMEIFTSQNLI